VSVNEWTDSASMTTDLVTRNPNNFAMAMPGLAKNAAMMAFLLPSVT